MKKAIFAGLALVTVLSGCGNMTPGSKAVPISTTYSAVLVDNGRVLFGKLDQTHPGYLLLTDAYFVVSGMNPDTKQVTNALSKLEKQLNAPDRIFISRRHVVAVEPVAANSQVAKAIENISQQK